jgi:hypothetical protein
VFRVLEWILAEAATDDAIYGIGERICLIDSRPVVISFEKQYYTNLSPFKFILISFINFLDSKIKN